MQEDDEVLDSHGAADSVSSVDSLVSAGLSPYLASPILESTSDQHSQDVGSSFLPWAVLLALLLELPPQSPRRLKISQAIHDSHRCAWLGPLTKATYLLSGHLCMAAMEDFLQLLCV